MSLLLNVPYSEKDYAKELGANWNPSLKKWYVNSRSDYPKFLRWILGNLSETCILCDYLYIVEGIRRCYKCHHETKVIGFGIENYYQVLDPEVYDTKAPIYYESGTIHIASELTGLPNKFYNFLKEKFNYKQGYSATLKAICYANHCTYCDALQGNYFLFDEVDSPFWIDSPDSAAKLNLYRINLHHDHIINLSLGISSMDNLIKEFGRIVTTNYTFD